jgi:glycosyltransferase involved in cell wall biosynthesis
VTIAFISTIANDPWGGSEELWAGAARAARRSGTDVVASVHRWRPEARGVTGLRDAGVRISTRWRLPGRWKQVDPVSGRVRPLFGELARSKPDVLCVSEGAAFDMVRDRPLHDAFRRLVETTGSPYVVVVQLNSDMTAVPAALRARAQGFYGDAAAVCLVAEANLRTLRRQLGVAGEHFRVVRNPVNLASTEPIPLPPVDDGVRFANVARLEVAYKGQDLLLEALSRPHWRDRPWELAFYGTGPDHSYLVELVRHYDLGERVRFEGHVGDIRGLWAREHALVLGSRHEGTPLAMVEAMLCGRVPIVTDVGGTAEWVDDGATGFLAPAPSVDAVDAALERAWTRRASWADLGLAARDAAVTRFDPEAGTRLLRVLEEVAAQPARSRTRMRAIAQA